VSGGRRRARRASASHAVPGALASCGSRGQGQTRRDYPTRASAAPRLRCRPGFPACARPSRYTARLASSSPRHRPRVEILGSIYHVRVEASRSPDLHALGFCRRAKIDACDPPDLRDRVVGEVQLFVGPPDGILVGAVREAEGAACRHVHVRPQVVPPLLGHGLTEFGVNSHELRFGDVLLGPTPLRAVVGVHEVLHRIVSSFCEFISIAHDPDLRTATAAHALVATPVAGGCAPRRRARVVYASMCSQTSTLQGLLPPCRASRAAVRWIPRPPWSPSSSAARSWALRQAG